MGYRVANLDRNGTVLIGMLFLHSSIGFKLWSSSKGRSGYTKVEAGPAHSPYGAFCPAPGHHLGFNDLKVIEVAELLAAHAGGAPCGPSFREAYEVQRTVEAMQRSHIERKWIKL